MVLGGGGDKQGTFARFARFARFFQRKGVERSPKIFFFPRQKKKKNSARPARGFGSQNGAQTLQPLQTTCGSAGVRLPYTPTPDCERDVHAGRVRGIGAIRGSRPCTRGAHVKPGAHLPSRCVGSFHSPLQKLAASPPVAGSRAELRAHRGHAAARRPSASAPSARTWLPGCSPKGVDLVRASPHHAAHPAPLSLGHQQELLDASVREAEGAQQPLLGPWAGDAPRLGTLLSRATSTSRCGVPSAAPHTSPPRRRQPRGRGGQASEPLAPPTRARRHQPPCRLGPTSAPSSYPFLRRSLGLGLGLACSFGDEQAPATFVCTRPRSAAPAPAHVQLCVAGLDAPGARCA